MTDQPQTAIRRNVERCEEHDGMSEADAKVILDTHQRLSLIGASEVSESHHSNALMRSAKMVRVTGGLTDALEDRDATEEVVRWMNRTHDNPGTNHSYRQALRAFGRHATDSNNSACSCPPGGRPSPVRIKVGVVAEAVAEEPLLVED